MTINEALLSPTRQLLLGVLFLLLTVQLVLIFASFRDGRSRPVKLLYVLHFLLSFAFFYLAMLIIAWDINFPNGEKAHPAALAVLSTLPAAILLLYEVLSIPGILAAFGDLIRYRKIRPTPESIKETMDLLPVGIAFGKPDGTAVFSNLVMNDLSRAVNGRSITDLSQIYNAANPESETLLALPDGSGTWQLSEKTLDVDGDPYIQLTATDISEQTELTKELEEKNASLRDIRMRLRIYNKQAGRIVIAQEMLTARMAVHNELGSILLESRHYINEPSAINEDVLLQALKSTNTYLLREYEMDDTARDALLDALDLASAIGVDVNVTGVLPSEDPARSVLASAITECATNTVKHADGNTLYVNIKETEGGSIYIFRSNGTPPRETVRETGGLSSLRLLVEKEGGSMRIENIPELQLTITMPQSAGTSQLKKQKERQ